MTPAQIYTAIATILGISEENAKLFADHLMALTLGRATTDSTSWRTSPPAQRNDLQTAEKMVTRLLNAMQTNMGTVQGGVDGFDARFTEVIGNHLPGQPEEELFKSIGSNLIKAVVDLRTQLDEVVNRPVDPGSPVLNETQTAALNSTITIDLVNQIKEYMANPPQAFRVMTTEEIDAMWDRVINK